MKFAFPAKVWRSGTSYVITIPSNIAKKLVSMNKKNVIVTIETE